MCLCGCSVVCGCDVYVCVCLCVIHVYLFLIFQFFLPDQLQIKRNNISNLKIKFLTRRAGASWNLLVSLPGFYLPPISSEWWQEIVGPATQAGP